MNAKSNRIREVVIRIYGRDLRHFEDAARAEKQLLPAWVRLACVDRAKRTAAKVREERRKEEMRLAQAPAKLRRLSTAPEGIIENLTRGGQE